MHKKFTYTSTTDLVSQIESLLSSQGWAKYGRGLKKNDVCISFRTSGGSEWVNKSSHINCIFLYLYSKDGTTTSKTANTFNGRIGRTALASQYRGNLVTMTYNVDFYHSDNDSNKYMTYKESDTHEESVGIAVPNSGVAYFNYTEKPVISCVVSINFTYNAVSMFQHLAFGQLEKSADYEGGTYVSGSRSLWGMNPQAKTVGSLDASSAPLFGTNIIPTTICWAVVDSLTGKGGKKYFQCDNLETEFAASGKDYFEHFHWRQNPDGSDYSDKWVTHYGTGKRLATSLVDVSNFNTSPLVPNYKHLQSSNSGKDYNRMMLPTECLAVALPIYFFIEREPVQLENFSYIGKVNGVCAVSIRNMADCSIHKLYADEKEDMYQIFPHSLRCGRHGYDGIAVKFDETDYAV